MLQLDAILADDLPRQVFFYLSTVAFLCFGAFVSWARSEPSRRRARWQRRLGLAR
jgi:hypothetical protein